MVVGKAARGGGPRLAVALVRTVVLLHRRRMHKPVCGANSRVHIGTYWRARRSRMRVDTRGEFGSSRPALYATALYSSSAVHLVARCVHTRATHARAHASVLVERLSDPLVHLMDRDLLPRSSPEHRRISASCVCARASVACMRAYVCVCVCFALVPAARSYPDRRRMLRRAPPDAPRAARIPFAELHLHVACCALHVRAVLRIARSTGGCVF
jgi:hypothetical protein